MHAFHASYNSKDVEQHVVSLDFESMERMSLAELQVLGFGTMFCSRIFHSTFFLNIIDKLIVIQLLRQVMKTFNMYTCGCSKSSVVLQS